MRHLELAVRRMMTCRSISFQHSGALSPAWISCRGIYQRCSRDISSFAARTLGTIRPNPNQLIRHSARLALSAAQSTHFDLGEEAPSKGRWYLDFHWLISFYLFPCSDVSHFHFLFPWQCHSVTSKCLSLARTRKPGRTAQMDGTGRTGNNK